MAGFMVEVVKVKGRVHWAVKAVVDGRARYRGHYYKDSALSDLEEWRAYGGSPVRVDIFRAREFMHNFASAEELNIKER